MIFYVPLQLLREIKDSPKKLLREKGFVIYLFIYFYFSKFFIFLFYSLYVLSDQDELTDFLKKREKKKRSKLTD